MFGKLPEVAVGAILLFANFVDHLGVAGNLLLHTNQAKTRANPRGEFDGEIECLAGAVGAVVCNQDSFEHIIHRRRLLRPL